MEGLSIRQSFFKEKDTRINLRLRSMEFNEFIEKWNTFLGKQPFEKVMMYKVLLGAWAVMLFKESIRTEDKDIAVMLIAIAVDNLAVAKEIYDDLIRKGYKGRVQEIFDIVVRNLGLEHG